MSSIVTSATQQALVGLEMCTVCVFSNHLGIGAPQENVHYVRSYLME